MKNRFWIAVVVIVAVLVVVSMLPLGGDRSEQTSTETSTTQDTAVEDESMDSEMTGSDDSMMSDAVEIAVEGGAFYFEPNTIRVNGGDTVRLTFENAGGTHDFVIDELNVATEITQTGETAVVEFVVPETPGTYEYYCSVANHRELGMVGQLIVE